MTNQSVDNFKDIQKAIDVERKYQYIDLKGKKKKFSDFIIQQLTIFSKIDKSQVEFKKLIKLFDSYKMANYSDRVNIVQSLIDTLNTYISESRKINKPSENKQDTSLKRSINDTSVQYLKGVGPQLSTLFNKLGINTIRELIQYYPKKHINYSSTIPIKSLKAGENATVIASVEKISAYATKTKLNIMTIELKDSTGKLAISFFFKHTNNYMLQRYKTQFPVGSELMVSGKVKIDNYTKRLTMDKPEYQLVGGELDTSVNLNIGRIVPVYNLTDGLSIKTLRKAIYNAVTQYKSEITELVPEEIKIQHALMDKQMAITQIHFPNDMEVLEKARRTLVFEELFLLQLKLFIQREAFKKQIISEPMKVSENGLVSKFIKSLPFVLTNSQQSAVSEILNDLNSEEPMQRLLQGDVGSGKTVVAVIMLLSAVENGCQGALMAPTEILAQQHFNNMIDWLTPLGISVSLFVGTNTQRVRRKIADDLVSGQTHIAIGTHALIQEAVEFKKLGAVVIDEQHRFGVNQRFKLQTKGKSPQMLTMTATPIPRTLALTVHGDLDLTVIDEMPKGRKPILTRLIASNKNRDMLKLLENEIKQGHQAYIVYPLIEESETLAAKAATIEAERFQNEVFPHLNIGLLHGKLPNDQKEQVMSDFKAKKYDILVSTTVVEVGVDVPNATVIIIEDAHRFGLSQLHQLRGRVGRSDLQSYCMLVSNTTNLETKQRLGILTQTNNGFIIAEKDLEFRGPGEYLGTRQSGIPDLVLCDLSKDVEILEQARECAQKLVQSGTISNHQPLVDFLNNEFTVNSSDSLCLS